jgi:hypothetical protein
VSENDNGNGNDAADPQPESGPAEIEIRVKFDPARGVVTQIEGPLHNQALMLGALGVTIARVNRMHDKLMDRAEAKRIVTPPPGLRIP